MQTVTDVFLWLFFLLYRKVRFFKGKRKRHTLIERMPGMVNQTIRNRDEKRLKNIESDNGKIRKKVC